MLYCEFGGLPLTNPARWRVFVSRQFEFEEKKMTVEQFYLFILFCVLAPFLSVFITFSAYKSALKSNNPYEVYGLNTGRGGSSGSAIFLSSMSSTIVCIFILVLQSKDLSLEQVTSWGTNKILFLTSTTIMGILNFPIVTLQAYILGHKLQKKFPDKITKRQINKDVFTSICGGLCFMGLIAYLLNYRP